VKRTAYLLVTLLAAAGCTTAPATPSVVLGTWGGSNAGMIVNDSGAHVHIGCTLGDLKGSIHVDANGHFSATGLYDITAYPISLGILHPAVFTGQVFGNTMLLTVQLSDTAVTVGPASLTYGAVPQMGPCPICRSPGDLFGFGTLPHGSVAGHRP
jgi:hypothetical protein